MILDSSTANIKYISNLSKKLNKIQSYLLIKFHFESNSNFIKQLNLQWNSSN